METRSGEAVGGDADAVFTALFLTAEGRANPYPLYEQLRRIAPVHRTRLGMWLLSRYDDCWAALRDPRLGKSYARQIEQRFGPDWRQHPSLTAGEHSMLNTSGPEHTRLRKLVTKSFTPRMIENLKPVIERVVTALLDPVAEAGGGNVLEAVGFPLPVTIIGEMLGVPEPDRPQFRGLVRDLVAIFEMQPTAAQMVVGRCRAARHSRLLPRAHRREAPQARRGPCLSRLAAGRSRRRSADRRRAGHPCLAAVRGRFRDHDQPVRQRPAGAAAPPRSARPAARATRRCFANLPDELLRYDGTVQMVNRVTEASVEVGGVTIPAGEQVFALLGAGNHDPARYADPDRST